MKSGRILGLSLSIGAILLIMVPCAHSQHLLSDVWFKMKITSKGHTMASIGSAIVPYSNISTVYVRFVPATGIFQHDWEMWSQDSETGNWASVSGTIHIYGLIDGLLHGWETEWTTSPPIGMAASITGIFKIQRDGTTTKKAKFTSTGCEIISGQTPSGSFYGGCKVTGTTIAPEKLPFIP